jgi:uncharacterized protein (DUF2267 family)
LRTIAGFAPGESAKAVEIITMSDTQIAALDHTVQQTNVWLKTLGEELHVEDRHIAYTALRAVLHVLRDRLTPEQAVHLGAQLPLLIRGLYYEGWRLVEKPAGERQHDEFAALVAAQMPPQLARDALRVTKAVFDVLAKELDHGEIAKIIGALPIPLRSLWPAKAA